MKHTSFKRLLAVLCSGLLAAPVITSLPQQKADAAVLLFADFETTNDSFTGRGGAEVQWGNEQYYTNNCSLFVSGRTASWNGAERKAGNILSAGATYSVSAAVYQESGEEVEMKFSIQYTNAAGETDYDKIALETAASGEWTELSNPAYTVPEGASNVSIYMETTESLTDFYLDAVTVEGAPSVIKAGDANGDLAVNADDVTALQKFLLGAGTAIEPGADFDGNGSINAADLSLLKYAILNPPEVTVNDDWDNLEETATPEMLKVYQDGILRLGNTSRLREKVMKAQSGEPVKIGYLGGSITRGGSSSSDATCYVTLSGEYFQKTFGTGSNVSYINAGEPGTSSVVGNMRVDRQIYAEDCDIIFIEFAVNDQDGDRFKKSYESLVKKSLNRPNEPAVILVTLPPGRRKLSGLDGTDR